MDASDRAGRGARTPLFFALILLCFAVVAGAVYRGALDGLFVSDDTTLITENPYVQSPGRDWLSELFDPTGRPRQFAGGNYAPLLHIGHAVEWRLWGGATRGYHVVNVLLHALNAALLMLLLIRSGLGERAAALAGALFLLHPANVEAVAWISQLRTVLALAFALIALCLAGRSPIASAVCFALGLLAKAAAAFALPMAAALWWCARSAAGPPRVRVQTLVLWLAVFAVYTPIQLDVFSTIGIDARGEPHPDLATLVRTSASIGAHYLAMAATGTGTAFFHAPEPVRSYADPWWWAGAAAAALFVWRIAVTLRRARPEAAWWLGAGAAFVPVSQVIPFFFPMADRYLYFILPGLIGGAAFALRDGLEHFRGRPAARGLRIGVWTAAAIACVGFAAQAQTRAGLWVSIRPLYTDSARAYPDGPIGHFMAAVEALEARDRAGAVASLRASMARGGHLIQDFRSPVLAGLRGDPAYEALLLDVSAERIAMQRARGEDVDPMRLAGHHYQRGELDQAIEALEEGIRRDGPQRGWVDLVQRLRRERDARERGETAEPRAQPRRPEEGPPGLPPLLR